MSVVYASSLEPLAKVSDALGVPFEALAHKVGIDIGLLNTPDATLPAEKYIRLHEEILQQTGNAEMGLLIGRVSYLESFHIYMSLASASNTFRDWINLIPGMSPAWGDLMKTSIRRKGDYFILEMRFEGLSNSKRCLITDSFLASSMMVMDGFCVLPVRPVRVDFTYAQPSDTTALQEAFRAPLHFDQPTSGVHYHKSVLDLPQLHVSTSVYDNVKEELEEFLSFTSWAGDSFTTNLYTIIRRQLPTGKCTVKSVAAALNMSSRTLQLRLKERDTQFRYFVQQVRSTLAVRYLQDKNFSIINIALLLGYGDPTSFSAAFKSWHGCSPREYRNR
ncbi:AraC family transcriptional regulator [Pseudomaricurvus alkylphenolicus]|uniref:AraC family transcriptional regulator n=1 Tax=Pseudomaricurvus alkylphenolicus TaxID=1306991 RepID=UPI00142394E0|nr:AraC family transcriptional regulator [Pseudomaricurvus alkylphenolicus]NIB44659.1 AraC family transcriptional regulator [Pseudomaricurvus alkylphenolicus]